MKGKPFTFFHKVFSALPPEYAYLLDALDKGVFDAFAANPSLGENNYSLRRNPSMPPIREQQGKNLQLKNILIWHQSLAYPLSISIADGVWIGFSVDRKVFEFVEFSVDLSALELIQNIQKIQKRITSLVAGLRSQHLNLGDLSKIELEGATFYQIRALDDGNCLAIDPKGSVYLLNHDPYEIKLIHPSIKEFVDLVNDGQVDFDALSEV